MADEYYGNAQFQTMLEQRLHDDKFVSEAIITGSAMDLGLSDFIEGDITTGNTATLRRHYKKSVQLPVYRPTIINGTVFPAANMYHGIIDDHTFFPMSPVKDDYSTAQGTTGYHGLPKTDPRRIATVEILDSLKMDSMDVAEKLLNPPPVGAVGSPEFHDYEKAWRQSDSLQEQYPTIEQYHAQIVADLQEQETGMTDVTDVFIGLYATGATLGEINIVAMYYTMEHLYPLITYNGANYENIPDLPAQSYMFEFISKNFVTLNGWHGWSHIIRQGLVVNKFDKDGSVKWYKRKANYRFVKGVSARVDMTDGDPIVQILQPNILEENYWRDAKLRDRGLGLLEIQVQLPDQNGVRVYGEIRIWDYGTLHSITANDGHVVSLSATMEGTTGSMPGVGGEETLTPTDGATTIGVVNGGDINYSYTMTNWGDSGGFDVDSSGVVTSVNPMDYATAKIYWIQIEVDDYMTGGTDSAIITVTVEVQNTNSEPEPPERLPPGNIDDAAKFGPNLLFFPFEYKATKKVPFFKRERLLRESTTIILYTVNEVNLEWYEKTWFKVVLFIVLVLIAIFFPGLSWAGWSAFSAEAVVTAVVQIAVTQVLMQGLLNAIDNPYIAFIVQVAALLLVGKVSGNINLSNLKFADVASIGLEATGTAVKKYYAQQIKELKEEYDDIAETLNKYEQEIDDFIENNGLQMRDDASDWVIFTTQTAVTETTDSSLNRTTNVDNAIIDDVDDMVDVTQFLKLYT